MVCLGTMRRPLLKIPLLSGMEGSSSFERGLEVSSKSHFYYQKIRVIMTRDSQEERFN
jgi:hypothetical protein